METFPYKEVRTLLKEYELVEVLIKLDIEPTLFVETFTSYPHQGRYSVIMLKSDINLIYLILKNTPRSKFYSTLNERLDQLVWNTMRNFILNHS